MVHRQDWGVGIGWRPELTYAIERISDLRFVEVIAEELDPYSAIPIPLKLLLERGVVVVPHGVSLSLGGAEQLDQGRLDRLARLAERLDAPLVSEHLAFVRAGAIEVGHLLPIERSRKMLEIAVENIQIARRTIDRPLAIENIATLFDWPNAEMEETDFLAEVLDRTDCLLLLDVANLYANAINGGRDPVESLKRLPLSRLAYVHIAGGVERDGVYHDTHTAPVAQPMHQLLEDLCSLTNVPGVLLERDGNFPSGSEVERELLGISDAVARGKSRRESGRGQ